MRFFLFLTYTFNVCVAKIKDQFMSFTFVCITVGRLQDVEVYFARERNAYTLVNYQSGVAGDSVTFTEDMFARWIKVTRRTPIKALSLCEVLVFGFLPDDTGKNTCCVSIVFVFLFVRACAEL